MAPALDEGRDPLDGIARRHDRREGCLFDREAAVDCHVLAAMDGRQRRGDREGRLRRDLTREPECRRHERLVRHHTVDEAEPERLLSAEAPARQDQLRRGLAADVARQALRSPKVGMMPMLISAFENTAEAAATAICVASTSSQPPPKARPLTAAMIGFG